MRCEISPSAMTTPPTSPPLCVLLYRKSNSGFSSYICRLAGLKRKHGKYICALLQPSKKYYR